MEMRTFVKNDNGKAYVKLDRHGNQKRVFLASLFMNRLLRPRMGMAAVAEYQVARLLNGESKEKQRELVSGLMEHRFISMEQAGILLKSGAITDSSSRLALTRYTIGDVGVHNAGNI